MISTYKDLKNLPYSLTSQGQSDFYIVLDLEHYINVYGTT